MKAFYLVDSSILELVLGNLWAIKICSLYFGHRVPLPIQLRNPVSAANFNSVPSRNSACDTSFCAAACCPKVHTITLLSQSPMGFSSAAVRMFPHKRIAFY